MNDGVLQQLVSRYVVFQQTTFADFDKDTWEKRTFLFREEIAKRFGFVATNIGINIKRLI